jgi:hypothetical protein
VRSRSRAWCSASLISFTCEWRGRELYIKGIEDGRPGSLLPEDHPLVRDHAVMFAPLTLTLMAELEQ